eukprot:89241_1
MASAKQFPFLKSRLTVTDERLIGGYVHQNFKREIPEAIFFTLILFWHIQSDTFGSPESKNVTGHKLTWTSMDKRTLVGLGYGTIKVNPSNTAFDNYQWLIGINFMVGDELVIGITSKQCDNIAWWQLTDDIDFGFSYNFYHLCEDEEIQKYLCIQFGGNEKYIKCEQFIDSNCNDTILLHLNTSNKTLSLSLNSECLGTFKNININTEEFMLAVDTIHSSDYITLVEYSQWNSKIDSERKSKSITNFTVDLQNKVNPAIELQNISYPQRITIPTFM